MGHKSRQRIYCYRRFKQKIRFEEMGNSLFIAYNDICRPAFSSSALPLQFNCERIGQKVIILFIDFF